MSAGSASDTGMMKIMAVVLGALVVFTLLFVTVARLLDDGTDGEDALMREALLRRIEPIGQVRTEPLAEAPVEEAVAETKTVEELVQGACANCHVAGVAGAPKLDDEAAWAQRRELGLETLIASVTNGKGAMPARGGSTYSDEEIKRAVQYMAGFEVDEPAGEADAGSDGNGSTDSEASADPSAEDASGGEPKSDGDSAAEAEDAGGNDAAANEAAGASNTDSGDDVDLVALIGSGQVPEGIDDKAKSTAEGLCAGCHATGVAGAPKLGDTEAWTPRAQRGLTALAQTVISGKGAMPPRGGSDLADEQIKAAVQHLMALQP